MFLKVCSFYNCKVNTFSLFLQHFIAFSAKKSIKFIAFTRKKCTFA